MSRAVRVLIVDDHAVVREGLQMFLEEADGVEVAGAAADGAEALALAERVRPDVILLDLQMPRLDGIETLHRLRQLGLGAQVLVLSTFAEDGQVRDAIRAGAIGYLLKDVLRDELVAAIRAAAEGRPTLHPEAQRRLMVQVAAPPAPPSPLDALTDRERDVLRLIARGQSNKAIASTLFLSTGTVKGYVSAILAKLGVRDRTQAALLAVRHGMAAE